jgi:hypothetical protein
MPLTIPTLSRSIVVRRMWCDVVGGLSGEDLANFWRLCIIVGLFSPSGGESSGIALRPFAHKIVCKRAQSNPQRLQPMEGQLFQFNPAFWLDLSLTFDVVIPPYCAESSHRTASINDVRLRCSLDAQ